MTVLEIKAAIRARDGCRCTECGMAQDEHIKRFGFDLNVHRTTPGSVYAVDKSCVTLCRPCHGTKPRRGRGTADSPTRLPISMLRQLDILVERNLSDRTEEVRNAVLEYLRQRGLWPPQP